MISSVSVVSRQTGQASTPANFLNRAALPSITGSAAAGPILPSPSTAVPSVTTATVLRLIVNRLASAGFFAMAMQTRATPGRVGAGQVVAVAQRHLGGDLDLAADVHQKGPVGDLPDLDPRQLVDRVGQLVSMRLRLRVGRDVHHHRLGRRLDDVEPGDDPAGAADRRGEVARPRSPTAAPRSAW